MILHLRLFECSGTCWLFSANASTQGDRASLTSPLLSLPRSPKMTFHYRMLLWNSNMTVRVYIQNTDSSEQLLLFSTSGNQSVQWQQVILCLPVGSYSLAFIGIAGVARQSEMVLDDVIIETDTVTCAYMSEPAARCKFHPQQSQRLLSPSICRCMTCRT